MILDRSNCLPLPPGSPLFQGREEELHFIKLHIRDASILIVGSHTIGKTSLLNQIYHWAMQERDLEPIKVNLLGVETPQAFRTSLAQAENESTQKVLQQSKKQQARETLWAIIQKVRQQDKLAIFLFNEVDGLAKHNRSLIEVWRDLHNQGLARFIMTGHSVIGRLGIPDSPFFHFTQGTHFGGKAIALTSLSRVAAEKLLDLLTDNKLGPGHWRNNREERKRAYDLLLERSYCIPWALQSYGNLLVKHMEQKKRDGLNWEDVNTVVVCEGNIVWQYINNFEYKALGYGGVEQAVRPGFQLILFTLARQRYFLGGPQAPIRDPRLREHPALDLGFTVGEARKMVEETIDELLMERREQDALEHWLKNLDLDQVLRLLTLTLALEPDPVQEDRYGFLLHILPCELASAVSQELVCNALPLQ